MPFDVIQYDPIVNIIEFIYFIYFDDLVTIEFWKDIDLIYL